MSAASVEPAELLHVAVEAFGNLRALAPLRAVMPRDAISLSIPWFEMPNG